MPSRHRSLLWISVAIFALAAGLRLGLSFALKEYKAPAYGEAVMVARSLAKTGEFANPYQIPTGPTAHVAPLYPFFLSLILRVVPWGPAFKWITIALGVFGSSLLWSLMPLCAVKLNLGLRAGTIAGVFGALNLLRHQVELDGAWETECSALAFLAVLLLTFGWRNIYQEPRKAFLLGLAWGGLLLLQPAYLPVFGGFLALLSLSFGPRRRTSRAFASVTVSVLGALLMLAPWMIRNYARLGGLVFTRSNFGLELSVSNNDHAYPDLVHNLHRNPGVSHPDVNFDEARRMASLGERNYYELRLRMAEDWIAAHPARFSELTALRVADFWVPERRSSALRAAEALIVVAASAGLWMLWRERCEISPFFVALWLLYPLVYYLIQIDDRYRYPLDWTMALCIGSLASRFWQGDRKPSTLESKRRTSPVISPGRITFSPPAWHRFPGLPVSGKLPHRSGTCR